MTQGQVKISNEFFAKAANDYADKYWAWCREICQNGLDAPGTTRIEVTIQTVDGNTVATVQNNGEPMTEDILLNKFLTLGGSGKNFQSGSVGGFGKAKELLVLMHPHYRMHTGTLTIDGSGGDYTLGSGEELLGTMTEVQWDGDQTEALISAFRKFIAYSQTEVEFSLNGEALNGHLRKGHPRREFEYGTVYTNNSFPRLMIVRIRGMAMFTRRLEWDKCVVVELKGESSAVLTSNRDGLRYVYREEMDKFILQLAVDKRSALRKQKAEYRRYEGDRLKNEAKKPQAVTGLDVRVMLGIISDDEQHTPDANDFAVAANLAATMPVGGAGIQVETVAREESKVSIGPAFILKNTTGMVTPDYYQPGDQFGSYGLKLAKMWARLLVELHRLFDHSASFSIGFVLDEDSTAEHEQSPEYGEVYYLNPAVLVSQQNKPQCRSFRKRWSLTEGYEILAVAAHEFVHGLGFSCHDESYSCELTRVTGVILRNMKRFTPLFRDQVMQ